MNVAINHLPRNARSSFRTGLLSVWQGIAGFFKEWFACFQSLHLAIILLTLLCLSTLIGVLMPQESIVEVAKIKETFGHYYPWLKAMGFFNVYSSYWFISFEVLFFFNLLFGSFQWLKPAFYAATRKCFCGPEHILASPNRFALTTTLSEEETLSKVSGILKKKFYTVHADPRHPQTRLYATKGNISRFGPVIAHLGILCLLVGCVYGTFTGFKAQKLAPPGTTFNIMQSEVWTPNIPEPFWQGTIPEWRIKVDDFNIKYYAGEPDMAKQYYANLSIINPDGSILKRQTISVNHPMQLGDMTIYQASYRPTGKFTMGIDGTPLTLDTTTKFGDRPVALHDLGHGQTLIAFPFFAAAQEPGVKEDYVVLFLKGKDGFTGAKPGEMPPTLKLRPGESGLFFGKMYTYIKPEIATGLQIKKAPEVPFVYTAFFIIILGAFMCIFSQRQLWIALEQTAEGTTRVLLNFKTNKARLSFIKELQALKATLERTLPCTN